MVAKLSLLLATALLACMALSSSALAATGVGHGKAITPASRAAATASTLIAPGVACPGQNDLSAPVIAQQEAMRCMTNFARERLGLAPLADAAELDLSASFKAGDLLACDSFSHSACGRDFTYWIRESGYLGEACWHAGENLAWGTGEYGSVRSIFQAWMRSPTHRKNLLGDYSQLGISLKVGDLAGQTGTRVWAQHFGSRCEASPAVS